MPGKGLKATDMKKTCESCGCTYHWVSGWNGHYCSEECANYALQKHIERSAQDEIDAIMERREEEMKRKEDDLKRMEDDQR